jgi:hypothetical protein
MSLPQQLIPHMFESFRTTTTLPHLVMRQGNCQQNFLDFVDMIVNVI